MSREPSLGIPRRAVPAFRRLRARLAEVDFSVPCTRDPDAWMGDDASLRKAAAAYCLRCPALAACRAYAAAAREQYGVWGGVDRSVRNPKTPDRRPTAGNQAVKAQTPVGVQHGQAHQ